MCVKSTEHEIYPLNKFLGEQHCIVNCGYYFMWQISRCYGSFITVILYPLNDNSFPDSCIVVTCDFNFHFLMRLWISAVLLTFVVFLHRNYQIFLFGRGFKSTFQLPQKCRGLFKLSVSYWMSCSGCVSQGNHPFHLSFLTYVFRVHSIFFFLMSASSVVISPVSFMILIICVLSLFLSVLLEIFQSYLSISFTKNQHISTFVSIFFFCFQFRCFLLLFTWYPSFCWLWIYFTFGSFLRTELGWSFRDFSFSLMFLFSATNFPPSNALAISNNFWYVVFLFQFNSEHFVISLGASFLAHRCFRSVLFRVHMFEAFLLSLCSEDTPFMILIILN